MDPTQDGQVSALPVLEGVGRVVGLVSQADLLCEEEFRDGDPGRSTRPEHPADAPVGRGQAGAVTAGS